MIEALSQTLVRWTAAIIAPFPEEQGERVISGLTQNIANATRDVTKVLKPLSMGTKGRVSADFLGPDESEVPAVLIAMFKAIADYKGEDFDPSKISFTTQQSTKAETSEPGSTSRELYDLFGLTDFDRRGFGNA